MKVLSVSVIIISGFLSFPASPSANAGALQHEKLDRALHQLVEGFPARVGVFAVDAGGATCINGNQAFSLQSVMKLIVCSAALDAVDHGRTRLDTQVIVHRQDLSLDVEPLAELVAANSFRTTVCDLIHRAIVDSDSAAADILVRRLGGPTRIQQFLERSGIQGVRIDRDERHLQTEIEGLTWRPEYVDPKLLNKAIASVPAARREASYRQYQRDVSDTAIPFGMASLLQRLASGRLLSAASTQFALQTMAQTVTFPDRLKAGVPAAWLCMLKTGTSGSWRGVTAATNDVGVLQAPDGTLLSIAVFVADTKEPADVRARLMRDIASATVANFR